MGAGDIGECGRAGAEKTAALLDQYDGMIFTAGDNAYMNGTAEEYRNCYNPHWGRHRARTFPSPGNHEYGQPGPAGYFGYYGAVAAPSAPGFYSVNLGAWHIVSLNTSIPVDANSAQIQWLRADLTANKTACAAAIFHHPLFSSGDNGGSARIRDIWRVLHAFAVDVVISGHDHVYERFAPQDADGKLDIARGVRQFTAGTGGAKLYGFPRVEPNSEVRGAAWGILRLALKSTDYAWEFIPVAGQAFRDSGTGTCR
jgi:3',5'-cyclic AMP phosphodiesterase CpdA